MSEFDKVEMTLDEGLALDVPFLLLYALPVMVALIIAEFSLSAYQRRDLYAGKDLLASLGVGAGNLILNVLTKVITLAFLLFFYNLALWHIPPVGWSYGLCFVLIDFCMYWAHRIAHERRFFWATHVTHHSSTKYNFTTSFRVSWTQHLKILFFVPIPLLGLHPLVFLITYQISVLYQFWIHTELIRKLPDPVEYLWVTPSHHRVHHGRNERYIDKNYGASLIIWDRMFGTFQEEDEKPVYGITKPLHSYNPVYLNFHEWIDLYRDVRKAGSLKKAIRLLIGRTGADPG
jgi:sterol desaturase/sphingolipid hydroxylase (fatty acid hydroxylase superfamily)